LKSALHKLFWIPVVIITTGIFYSCENDLDKVKKVHVNPDSPDETSKNLHIVYTDSGLPQLEIFATIAETYSQPKSKTKFKDGLRVNFYTESGETGSVLTSLFGEIDNESGNIVVRDSVKLVNLADNRTLETEELFWNKGEDSIYTNKSVVITSSDMIISGMGAWTTPAFDTAQFYQPTATIYLNKDKNKQ